MDLKNVSLLFALLGVTVLVGTGCAGGGTIEVNPRGEFADIDTTKSMAAIEAIQRRKSYEIAQIQADPGAYQPPVLYALAGELFRRGERDEAMYWFYLGQLRARSDANKSLDPSAGSGVDLMTETFGPPINGYAFQDVSKLTKTVERVVATDASLPRNYDPRWIALHGMDAFTEDQVRFAPQSQWASTDEKTRRDYLAAFREAIKSLE